MNSGVYILPAEPHEHGRRLGSGGRAARVQSIAAVAVAGDLHRTAPRAGDGDFIHRIARLGLRGDGNGAAPLRPGGGEADAAALGRLHAGPVGGLGGGTAAAGTSAGTASGGSYS